MAVEEQKFSMYWFVKPKYTYPCEQCNGKRFSGLWIKRHMVTVHGFKYGEKK